MNVMMTMMMMIMVQSDEQLLGDHMQKSVSFVFESSNSCLQASNGALVRIETRLETVDGRLGDVQLIQYLHVAQLERLVLLLQLTNAFGRRRIEQQKVLHFRIGSDRNGRADLALLLRRRAGAGRRGNGRRRQRGDAAGRHWQRVACGRLQ
jgi:hypothetical protein